jgi:hypothetical protein
MIILFPVWEVLRTYPHAFDEKLDTGVDQEISYCYRKFASLRSDKKFDQMFILDLDNRKVVLDLLEKIMEVIKTNDFEKLEILDAYGRIISLKIKNMNIF